MNDLFLTASYDCHYRECIHFLKWQHSHQFQFFQNNSDSGYYLCIHFLTLKQNFHYYILAPEYIVNVLLIVISEFFPIKREETKGSFRTQLLLSKNIPSSIFIIALLLIAILVLLQNIMKLFRLRLPLVTQLYQELLITVDYHSIFFCEVKWNSK